ncbi:hypothetical protein SEA_CLOWN_74 [Gordonia phage Clown]|uniref:Helix-turn-helix DNA binding domain protein n=1 Tax=Gordonia phage Clown TaxID=2759393 RepID=A0A7L7SI13_9CAUD|nr:replication initiation protein [Gordonia phage Clown]QOC56072.1 hypothetical protein SEA_CLOWN_74 [Gordonia phage Clown]
MSDRWFKVDTSIVRNPKVLQLSRTQRWALIELWAYAAEDLTDGVISRTYCDQMIGKRLRNVMLEHGFLHWIEVDKTLQIHDYLEHQQSRTEVLAVSEKRRQAGRKGGKAKAARAKQAASNLPDQEASTELDQSPSKNVADKDKDIDNYLRSYPTSPKSPRANDDGNGDRRARLEHTRAAFADATQGLIPDTFDDGTPLPAEPDHNPDTSLELVPAIPDRMPNGRRIPAHNRRNIARELNATARSAEADQFVGQFIATLDGNLDRHTRTEIAQTVDELMRDGIPRQQIANGLVAWQRSDSWSPTQIRRFVAKAATTNATPTPGNSQPTKATQRAIDTLAAAERLIAERNTP